MHLSTCRLGTCSIGYFSLDVHADGEPSLLDQLAAPASDESLEASLCIQALEQLGDQLPTGQTTALRLTLLEGLPLRAAAERLEISAMSVQRSGPRRRPSPPCASSW